MSEITQTVMFGYVPTEWICAVFLTLFSVSTILHAVEAVYFRLWWLFPTAVVAGLFEIIGWGARLWSSRIPNSPNFNPYLMQISTTIIAPTPLVAANFIILGRMIQRLGSEYSRLSATWYTIVFLTSDVVALIVQAAGGGIASQQVQHGEDPDKPGGHIMLGGIVFQMAAIVVYVFLAFEFLLRYARNWPIRRCRHQDQISSGSSHRRRPTSSRTKLMLFGMGLMTVFIFIRSIYRTIELVNGFAGTIIHTQVLFNVLDGAMIVLAMFTLNILHPGVLLVERSPEQNSEKAHTKC